MNSSKLYQRQRRVHFSDDCLTFATIIPNRTPSPSHSDSASDESDPPTPPNVQYMPTPYPFAAAALLTSPPSSQGSSPSPSQFSAPMPPTQFTIGIPTPTPSPPNSYHLPIAAKQQPQQMNVHFLLAYSPYASSPLNYNLLNPPPPDLLEEPATNPPLPQMLITCPFLPGGWQIRVTPGPVPTSLNGTDGLFSPATTVYSPLLQGSSDEIPPSRGYVTVLDVFYALYISLRTVLRQPEYQSLVALPSYSKETVNAAFWARLAQIEDPVKKEEQRCRGVRRVDFLGGRTRFLGLAGTLKEDVWELELGHVEAENW
ncbi:hypothetical protein APHAL10511_006857 [Amanita phalloides]|nr:hypothetical protein APHAL10511_006857 [Amanita phalloides]